MRWISLLLLVLAACASRPTVKKKGNVDVVKVAPEGEFDGAEYASAKDRVMYLSSVRVAIFCADKTVATGSGAVISATDVVSAGHVLSGCGDAAPIGATVVLRDGTSRRMEPKRMAEDLDIFVMELEAGAPPFPAWPLLAPRYPKVGETVCAVTNQTDVFGMVKCGKVAQIVEGKVVWTSYVVPGNSGSPLFDVEGKLIGITVAGTFPTTQNLAREQAGIAVPTIAWLSILAP